MTDYEISKKYENWGAPPEWAYHAFAFVVFVVWPAVNIVAVLST